MNKSNLFIIFAFSILFCLFNTSVFSQNPYALYPPGQPSQLGATNAKIIAISEPPIPYGTPRSGPITANWHPPVDPLGNPAHHVGDTLVVDVDGSILYDFWADVSRVNFEIYAGDILVKRIPFIDHDLIAAPRGGARIKFSVTIQFREIAPDLQLEVHLNVTAKEFDVHDRIVQLIIGAGVAVSGFLLSPILPAIPAWLTAASGGKLSVAGVVGAAIAWVDNNIYIKSFTGNLISFLSNSGPTNVTIINPFRGNLFFDISTPATLLHGEISPRAMLCDYESDAIGHVGGIIIYLDGVQDISTRGEEVLSAGHPGTPQIVLDNIQLTHPGDPHPGQVKMFDMTSSIRRESVDLLDGSKWINKDPIIPPSILNNKCTCPPDDTIHYHFPADTTHPKETSYLIGCLWLNVGRWNYQDTADRIRECAPFVLVTDEVSKKSNEYLTDTLTKSFTINQKLGDYASLLINADPYYGIVKFDSVSSSFFSKSPVVIPLVPLKVDSVFGTLAIPSDSEYDAQVLIYASDSNSLVLLGEAGKQFSFRSVPKTLFSVANPSILAIRNAIDGAGLRRDTVSKTFLWTDSVYNLGSIAFPPLRVKKDSIAILIASLTIKNNGLDTIPSKGLRVAVTSTSLTDTSLILTIGDSGYVFAHIPRKDFALTAINGHTLYGADTMSKTHYFFRESLLPDTVALGAFLVNSVSSSIVRGGALLDNSLFTLDVCKPDPFSISTSISYELKKSGNALLEVFDESGKTIETMINHYLPAGRYESSFNSNSLPSGTYFYRLTVGGISETQKMSIVR